MSAAQLKFTTATSGPPDSLSARFPPRPSPLELQSAHTVRGAGPCGSVLAERLALAVRLARRDLHLALARGARPLVPPLLHVRTHKLPQAVAGGPATPSHTEAQVPCQPPLLHQRDQVARAGEEVEVEEREKGTCTQGKRVCVVVGDGEGVSSELARLKTALGEQVQRLRDLCASEGGRVGWEKGEMERERKRAAEQVAAMTRKLYDLQRQVLGSGGEGECRAPPVQASKRLAAACRAATRALHSFSSTEQPLPSELLRLVGQLCGDQQSSKLLALAQTYSDYLRTARLHAPSPQRTRPEVKGNLHGRGRRGGQRKSLLHRQPPRGGQPPLPTPSSAARSHFSETTHSSRARQQATQIRPTPASRTEHHKSRRRGWGMSGGEGRRTERERGGGEGQQVDRGGEVEEGEGEEGEGEEGEGEGRAAPDNVVPSPHPPPSSQPTPPPPSSQPTPPPPSSQPSPPPPSSQPTPPPPSSQPTPPPPSSQPTPPPPSSQPTPPPPSSQPSPHTTQQQQDSLLSLPHLVGMTTTLQQMEEEEQQIRRKWNNRTQTSTRPTAEQEGRPVGTQDMSVKDWLHKPRGNQDRATLGRPGHAREHTGFEPWSLLERLADSLLEEALSDTCAEMTAACDCLASSLFSQEFQHPGQQGQESRLSQLGIES